MRTGGAARVAHPAHALHAQARQESIAIGVGTLDAHLAEVAAPLALLVVDPARELLLGVLRARHRDLPQLLLRGSDDVLPEEEGRSFSFSEQTDPLKTFLEIVTWVAGYFFIIPYG